ncbi:MAG: helix-turn-helix domain-containing protein [Chloroflexi bacterium]|nr:MAG: helix-turn-helix domain-containing protein [Chloroflexota bacterium]
MRLGDRIRQIRDELGLTQGQLASGSSVSQGYLSQLENGEVKNPSAAVLLRVAQAMQIDPDELFEAAGYPTVRMLRQVYQDYESTVDAGLLGYLGKMPRDRQRRLLLILQGMEQVLNGYSVTANGPDWATPDGVTTGPLALKRSPVTTVSKGHPELRRARR